MTAAGHLAFGESYRVKERTILTSLVVDFLLWIPDIIAAALSGSIVMFADVLKSGNEILATFFSYITVRKMARGGPGVYDYGMGKLETLTSVSTGGAMFVSLLLVFGMALYRIAVPAPIAEEGTRLAVLLMVLGVCTNTWLWLKNYRLAKKDTSPIMESQWRLFRAKAFSDFSVFVTLVLSLVLAPYPWSLYIDPLGSFVIAGFLLLSGYHVISTSLPDLLDKTLDEELQIVILSELAAFFDDYTALHGIRSRKSGSSVYIEILLEFDGGLKMSVVQERINRMKASLEKKIQNSVVSIVPSTSTFTREKQG